MFEGIKFNSIFNSLDSFHVCSPGPPPCVAHDLFEGVVSYDLPLFLESLVKFAVRSNKQLNLTLNLFNMRLEGFNFYGSDAAVKPPQFKASMDKLSGSASQNWCMLRVTPILISDVIDADNEICQTLLYLLRSVT